MIRAKCAGSLLCVCVPPRFPPLLIKLTFLIEILPYFSLFPGFSIHFFPAASLKIPSHCSTFSVRWRSGGLCNEREREWRDFGQTERAQKPLLLLASVVAAAVSGLVLRCMMQLLHGWLHFPLFHAAGLLPYASFFLAPKDLFIKVSPYWDFFGITNFPGAAPVKATSMDLFCPSSLSLSLSLSLSMSCTPLHHYWPSPQQQQQTPPLAWGHTGSRRCWFMALATFSRREYTYVHYTHSRTQLEQQKQRQRQHLPQQ